MVIQVYFIGHERPVAKRHFSANPGFWCRHYAASQLCWHMSGVCLHKQLPKRGSRVLWGHGVCCWFHHSAKQVVTISLMGACVEAKWWYLVGQIRKQSSLPPEPPEHVGK